jgi:hypothetical protein
MGTIESDVQTLQVHGYLLFQILCIQTGAFRFTPHISHAAPDGTGMIIPCHQTFDSRLQGFGEFEPIRAKNLYSIVFEGIM